MAYNDSFDAYVYTCILVQLQAFCMRYDFLATLYFKYGIINDWKLYVESNQSLLSCHSVVGFFMKRMYASDLYFLLLNSGVFAIILSHLEYLKSQEIFLHHILFMTLG